MKIQIVGKNLTVTDAMKAYVEKDLEKVSDKFEHPGNLSCRVLAQANKVGAKAEITVWGKGKMVFRAEVRNEDFYAAVDLAVDKLVDQVRRFKTETLRRRSSDSLRHVADDVVDMSDPDADPEPVGRVVRVKPVDLDPMTVDEAIERMDALGHSFFVYLDSDDGKISVVYKRLDEGYGVIEVDSPKVKI